MRSAGRDSGLTASAEDLKPKFGPDATTVQQSDEYFRTHEAPHYWDYGITGITVTLYLTTKHNSLRQRFVRNYIGVE